MTHAQKRTRKAWRMAQRALARPDWDQYAYVAAVIERRLKREDFLNGLIRWYESECQRLKSGAA